MSKYFVVNPTVEFSPNEVIEKLHNSKLSTNNQAWVSRGTLAKKAIEKEPNLKYVNGRVVVKADLQSKNVHTFSDGSTIRLERQFNEFNRRITEPVNAIVVSAENIPKGSEILIGHNSLHDTNKLFDCDTISPDVGYFSLPIDDCFAWRDGNGEMKPMKNYEFGLRVFKPYAGIIQNIEPELLKEVLYASTGEYKGYVVNVLKAADYEIIFQGQDGKEKHLIRFRHSEDESFDREEVLCVNIDLTNLLKSGKLLIGYGVSDAKPLNIFK